MDTKTARIRALNDELRQNFAEGIAVMTPGIAALGAEAVARKDNVFTLPYRDFPSLPKFFRDRFGIALMYPQAADASGPSRGWDELRPRHLVIAHESPADGWWEAIVLERKDDAFTLQFRDYTDLPHVVRHKSGIALMHSPTKET